MIVECGKVVIDTDQAWAEHRVTINKKAHCFCNDDKPVQWFTQPLGSGGRDRFYHLHYNKKGDALQKIDSWDDPPPRYKEVRKVKGDKEVCYFTKQDERLEYCMVKERDYSVISENPMTHWKEGWTEQKHREERETKSKPWWKFF